MNNPTSPEGAGDPSNAEITTTPERLAIGIATRATNAAERAADPGTGPIGQLWSAFMLQNFLQHVPNQAEPGEIVAVYTDYDSDQDGEYLAVLGRTVTSLGEIPEGMVGLAIPAQTVAAIPVSGDLAQSIPATWDRANALFTPDYRLQRTFKADLDVYPTAPSEHGPSGTILIGIHPESA